MNLFKKFFSPTKPQEKEFVLIDGDQYSRNHIRTILEKLVSPGAEVTVAHMAKNAYDCKHFYRLSSEKTTVNVVPLDVPSGGEGVDTFIMLLAHKMIAFECKKRITLVSGDLDFFHMIYDLETLTRNHFPELKLICTQKQKTNYECHTSRFEVVKFQI